MAEMKKFSDPKTFFLNESHELVRSEKMSGGRPPTYLDVNWATKGHRLFTSMAKVQQKLRDSGDPTSGSRYFFSAKPQTRFKKASTDKKMAPDGYLFEQTDFAGDHARIFRRLGIDLLSVSPDGVAAVHATVETFQKLLSSANNLNTISPREQAKWVAVDAFDVIGPESRAASDWVMQLKDGASTSAIIELQPVLGRSEVDNVFRKIGTFLQAGKGEHFLSTGLDFSGRHWVRGKFSAESIKKIASIFSSIQSIHPPAYLAVAASKVSLRSRSEKPTPPARSHESLPVVAVVDVGLTPDHSIMSPYKVGQVIGQDCIEPGASDHGTFVASRVVFGELGAKPTDDQHLNGTCRFLDVAVAAGPQDIEVKAVLAALQTVVSAYPDVRVFNMSFGHKRPLSALNAVDRMEQLILLRDLDNFIFANDIVVVICAGNSAPGIMPSKPYPHHVDVPEWALGSLAMGFNAIVCGSFLGKTSSDGVAKTAGWPSPFSRVGPGIANCPVPGFGAPGGDCGSNFHSHPGLGVYGYNGEELWEDRIGTSHAAPLLSREAAFVFRELESVCDASSKPFGATVKAFLALAARPPKVPEAVNELAKRTIGRGYATANRLKNPAPETAVLIWQGILESPNDTARIQVPIPHQWIESAVTPVLRVVWAWDSPVNDAAEHHWGCRKVSATLRHAPEQVAILPQRARGAKKAEGVNNVNFSKSNHPIKEKSFSLSPSRLLKRKIDATKGMWVLELYYQDVAEYFSVMAFTPQQRVGVCLELFDSSEKPVSPQSFVQALPLSSSMTKLTVPKASIQSPVVIRFRR